MGRIKDTIEASVFKRLSEGSAMSDRIAAYFHRASAIIYFIYSMWAILALIDGIPSLILAQGQDWQLLFSAVALVFTGPAAFGATFFPKYARTEMASGLLFVGLMLLYVGILVYSAIYLDGSWAGATIISSILVIPVFRVMVVIILLLEQAKQKRKSRLSRSKD